MKTELIDPSEFTFENWDELFDFHDELTMAAEQCPQYIYKGPDDRELMLMGLNKAADEVFTEWAYEPVLWDSGYINELHVSYGELLNKYRIYQGILELMEVDDE